MLGYIFAGMLGIFLKGIIDENGRAYEQNKYRELTYEKNLKEENALKIFNERKNELISSFSNKLVEDFSNNMDFCKQEMDKEYDKYTLELNEYIDQITEIENEENLFNSRINKSLENLAQNMGKNEVNHLNILLIGPSGVGKSCLINSILKSEK